MLRPDVVNDFEAWAKVSSMLIHKDEAAQATLLARLDLADVWQNANAAWAKALADDIVDMRLDRAQRYAEICASVLGRDPEEAYLLSLSMSDEFSQQTTLKMRAHPGAPPSESTFVDTLVPTHTVPKPQRRQATTLDTARDFDLPSPEDSGETSIYDGGD